MIVVLDANAALEIAFKRPQAQVFAAVLYQADSIIAPDLFLLETANALWKVHRFGQLPTDDVFPLMQDVLGLINSWYSISSLYQKALSFALAYQVTVYDASYLVLAQEEKASLLSLDQKICKVAQGVKIDLAVS